MHKLMPLLIIVLIASSSCYAGTSSHHNFLTSIQALERDFIGCNITYRTLGSVDQYDICTNQNQHEYKQLIARIKSQFNNDHQWKALQDLAVRHHQACLTTAQNSPTNQSLVPEIASCNHFYLYSLAANFILSNNNNLNSK